MVDGGAGGETEGGYTRGLLGYQSRGSGGGTGGCYTRGLLGNSQKQVLSRSSRTQRPELQ